MSGEYEPRLEAEVDAVLKGLPDRQAPPTLLPRVMAAIEGRAALPWHRQSWQVWPAAARIASLATLLALFGGLCLAGWKLPQADAYASVAGVLSHWFSGVCAVWNALSVLFAAGSAMLKQLPRGLLGACLISLGLGYALCLGLGAAWLRLAFARR
jgi:hypothetical protein